MSFQRAGTLTNFEKQIKCTVSGNWQDAAFYHTIACRTVCALGCHTDIPPDCDAAAPSLEDRKRRHGRKLFSLCYTIDKDISLHTGDPPLLIDDFCDLTFIKGCLSTSPGFPGSATSSEFDQADHDSITPVFSGNVGLSLIKERVCRLLYSPKAFKDFDIQVLQNIRHLDDLIEHWRLCIPAPQRPSLIPSSSFNAHSSGTKEMHHILLQLEYLYLMTVVHMAVRRFRVSSTDPSDIAEDHHRLIHSSVDISLEASRSIFACLRVMIDALAERAFWYVAPLSFACVDGRWRAHHSYSNRDLGTHILQSGRSLRHACCYHDPA